MENARRERATDNHALGHKRARLIGAGVDSCKVAVSSWQLKTQSVRDRQQLAFRGLTRDLVYRLKNGPLKFMPLISK